MKKAAKRNNQKGRKQEDGAARKNRLDLTGQPERSTTASNQKGRNQEDDTATKCEPPREGLIPERIPGRIPVYGTSRKVETKKTKLQQKANHRGKALSRRESQGESRLMEQATKGEPSRESLIPERIPGRTPVNGTSNGRRTSARKFHSGENGALGDALEDIRGRLGRPWGRRRRPRRTCWGSLGFPGGARDIREFFG